LERLPPNNLPAKRDELGMKEMKDNIFNEPVKSRSNYLERSKTMSLGARCPLLGRCERRFQTIAIANDEDPRGLSAQPPETPKVSIIGEPPSKAGGDKFFGVSGLCPEVPCFEPIGCLSGFRGVPITSGSFDIDFPDEKYLPADTKHYSECAEYCALPDRNEASTASRSWLTRNYTWLITTVISLINAVTGR
jgi:hypothetical protein